MWVTVSTVCRERNNSVVHVARGQGCGGELSSPVVVVVFLINHVSFLTPLLESFKIRK